MPIRRIEVSEYECSYCGYKWVNRVNGKDGPIPKKCAKCKRGFWNEGERPANEYITSEESGLRRRIKGLRGLYVTQYGSPYSGYWDFEDGNKQGEHKFKKVSWDDVAEKWPEDLAERFLSLEPRPTIEELKQVVYPRGLTMKPVDSQTHASWRYYVPDPDKPGYSKYDPAGHIRLRKQEALKRLEAMQQVIQSRQGQGQGQGENQGAKVTILQPD